MSDMLFDATADETVADVSTVPTRVHAVHIANGDAAVRYLQLFNLANGDVTLGTTTPDVVIPLATSGVHHIDMSDAPYFTVACSYAVTTTATGSTGPTTEAVVTFYFS